MRCLDAYCKMALGKDFRVQAVARERREAAMARAEGEVQRQRGDVIDFRMFSNLSLTLIVEMTGGGVVALVDSLVAVGWHVDVEPRREVLAGRSGARLEGTFQVTFPDGDGELAIRGPLVPG